LNHPSNISASNTDGNAGKGMDLLSAHIDNGKVLMGRMQAKVDAVNRRSKVTIEGRAAEPMNDTVTTMSLEDADAIIHYEKSICEMAFVVQNRHPANQPADAIG